MVGMYQMYKHLDRRSHDDAWHRLRGTVHVRLGAGLHHSARGTTNAGTVIAAFSIIYGCLYKQLLGDSQLGPRQRAAELEAECPHCVVGHWCQLLFLM